jgi:enoyl-CoA hydratase/carnithine racemase
MAGPPLVGYEVSHNVAIITLNHPPVNALSSQTWKAIAEAMDRLARDTEVSVAILTASGTKAFSAGADTKEIAESNPATRAARLDLVLEIMMKVVEVPVPLICAINGPAVGGGLLLACLADYRIAADHAHFSLPEIDRAAVGDGGAIMRRLGVPRSSIREMLFTGRRVSAPEALSIRVVDKIVPFPELMSTSLELAEGMRVKSREGLILMKRAILASERETQWEAAFRATYPFAAEMATLSKTSPADPLSLQNEGSVGRTPRDIARSTASEP